MKRRGGIIVLALCWSLPAIAVSIPVSSLAAGPPSGLNVNVTNTPLPVRGTVAISNFPASPGTQPVSVQAPISSVGACSPLGGQSANFNVLVGPDGSETVFTIPSGSVLVITAVDVLGFDAAPGAGIQTRLFRGVLGTGFSVFSLRESVAGPDGRIFHRYEFPSGVEVASAGLVCANSNNNDLVMSGFLYGFVK